MSRHRAPEAQTEPPRAIEDVQVEYFQRAIDRLESFRDLTNTAPADWAAQPTHADAIGYVPALQAHVADLGWSGYVRPAVAKLVEALYATIDAQVAILTEAIRQIRVNGFLYTQEDAEYKLAHTILGVPA